MADIATSGCNRPVPEPYRDPAVQGIATADRNPCLPALCHTAELLDRDRAFAAAGSKAAVGNRHRQVHLPLELPAILPEAAVDRCQSHYQQAFHIHVPNHQGLKMANGWLPPLMNPQRVQPSHHVPEERVPVEPEPGIRIGHKAAGAAKRRWAH